MPEPIAAAAGSPEDAQPNEQTIERASALPLSNPEKTISWLEGLIAEFRFDVIGLARAGNLPNYPLPTEPGALANILEVSAAGYLEAAMGTDSTGAMFRRGGQRAYPDIELSDGNHNDLVVALDIKVARRKEPPKRLTTERRTKSRIALLTGNTYFANPSVKYSSLPRPYGEYAFHLDWVILFSIEESVEFPEVTDIEHVVAETWRIASTKRPSSTRNYIGAVDSLRALKGKRGEFESRKEFETYWRSFNWNKQATSEELKDEAEAVIDGG